MRLQRLVYAALPASFVTTGLLVAVILGNPAWRFAGLALVLSGLYVWKRREDARAVCRRRSFQRGGGDGPDTGGEVTSLYAKKQPCLVFLNGDPGGAVYRLSSDATLIGSSSECDITLAGDNLSPRQARIDLEPGKGAILTDLDSSSGTWLQGERVSLHPSRRGGNMRLGTGCLMKFELRNGGQSQSRPNASGEGMRKANG